MSAAWLLDSHQSHLILYTKIMYILNYAHPIWAEELTIIEVDIVSSLHMKAQEITIFCPSKFSTVELKGWTFQFLNWL